MASLTESATLARKMIKYGAIGFVGITLFWYLGGFALRLYRRYFPVAPPPPQVGFGKLDDIHLPQESGRPEMVLELPTAGMPVFPDRMTVYNFPLKRSSFLDANRAIEKAAKLGFSFKPEEVSKTSYVWNNQDQLHSKLEMNIVSGYFTLTRQWQNDPGLLSNAGFKSDAQVLLKGVNFLRKSDALEDDMLGQEKISYLKADSGKLVPALSLSDADFVQIDFFRKNREEADPESKEVLASYPFYRPKPGEGLVRLVLSGSIEPNEKLVYFESKYRKVDYEKFSTYPIKSGQEAWEELKKGGGFVTEASPKKGTIKIRRIFLGYFDGDKEKYTMPIYVFLGDKNFVAYVSAVSSDWLK